MAEPVTSPKPALAMQRYYVFVALLFVVSATIAVTQAVVNNGYRTDQNKVADIQALELAIQSRVAGYHQLPTSLTQVTPASKLSGKLTDYTYTPKTYNQYQLCAKFAHVHEAPAGESVTGGAYVNPTFHGAGYQCFTYTVYNAYRLPIQPEPFIRAGSGPVTCQTGTRDQNWTVGATWQGFRLSDQTVTVNSANQQQTFHWCTTPIATNLQGYDVSMAAIPIGATVTLSVVTPGTANANGTVTYGQPYVTKIVETQAAAAK